MSAPPPQDPPPDVNRAGDAPRLTCKQRKKEWWAAQRQQQPARADGQPAAAAPGEPAAATVALPTAPSASAVPMPRFAAQAAAAAVAPTTATAGESPASQPRAPQQQSKKQQKHQTQKEGEKTQQSEAPASSAQATPRSSPPSNPTPSAELPRPTKPPQQQQRQKESSATAMDSELKPQPSDQPNSKKEKKQKQKQQQQQASQSPVQSSPSPGELPRPAAADDKKLWNPASARKPVNAGASTPPASSPALTPATPSGSPPRQTPLDASAKKSQAAALFELMHKGNKGAGKQQGGGSQKQQNKPQHSNNGGGILGNIDLGALISRSQQDHVRAKEQQRTERHEQMSASPGREPNNATSCLDDLMNAAPATAATSSSSKPSVGSSSHAEQFRLIYEQTKQDEQQLAAMLSGLARQTGGNSGDLRSRAANLRSALRAAYLSLLLDFSSKFSVQKNIVHRLWMTVYRELEPALNEGKEREKDREQKQSTEERIRVGGVPLSTAGGAIAPVDLFSAERADEEAAFRERLSGQLEAQFQLFDGLCAKLNAKYGVFGAPPAGSPQQRPHSSESIHCAKQLLSSLSVCLGDLERYRQQYLMDSPDFARATSFYQRSLLLDPTSALASKSWNQLAVVRSRKDAHTSHKGVTLLEALYAYTRAQSTVSHPFPGSRENVLNLFEENRLHANDIVKRIEGNQKVVGWSDLSILCSLFIRLLSILDTHIGVESFQKVYKIAIEGVWKSVLNEDWFGTTAAGGPGGAKEKRITESLALKFLLLALHMAEQYLIQDAMAEERLKGLGANAGRNAAVLANFGSIATASKGSSGAPAAAASLPALPATLSPSLPFPFALSVYSQQALSILYELLAVLLRVPVLVAKGEPMKAFTQTSADGATSVICVPYLPTLTLALQWIRCKWPWILTQSSDTDSFKTSPCEQVRTGLAQFANMLQTMDLPADENASSAAASGASLMELIGFRPLASCGFFPSPPELLDTFTYQSSSLLTFASAILHVHPVTGRFSSMPPPPSALTPQELEALRKGQEQWQKDNARRAASTTSGSATGGPAKKRASKQAKPRPWMLEGGAAGAGEENKAPAGEQEAGEDDEAEEGESDVPEDATAAAEAAAVVAARQQMTSALEAMMGGLSVESSSSSSHVDSSSIVSSNLTSRSSTKPLLVLDAPNIAMSHGNHKLFSVRGVEIVMEYFQRRGFRVLAFLPEWCLDFKIVGERRRAIKVGFEVKAASVPDNVGLLKQWHAEGLIATTPAQDYDDTYLVDFAMKHENALIVSNDKYRDHAQFHAATPAARTQMLHWLQEHVISYTFVGDEWYHNPDWKLDATQGLRKIQKHHQGQQQPRQHHHYHAR